MKLADVLARFGAQGPKARTIELRNGEALTRLQPIVLRLTGAAVVFFDIAAGENPFAAARGQAFLDVDLRRIVRVRTGRVVKTHGRLAARQRHLAERHAIDQQLARSGQGPARNCHGFRSENGLVHTPLPTPVLAGSGSKGLARARSQPCSFRAPLDCPDNRLLRHEVKRMAKRRNFAIISRYGRGVIDGNGADRRGSGKVV